MVPILVALLKKPFNSVIFLDHWKLWLCTAPLHLFGIYRAKISKISKIYKISFFLFTRASHKKSKKNIFSKFHTWKILKIVALLTKIMTPFIKKIVVLFLALFGKIVAFPNSKQMTSALVTFGHAILVVLWFCEF